MDLGLDDGLLWIGLYHGRDHLGGGIENMNEEQIEVLVSENPEPEEEISDHKNRVELLQITGSDQTICAAAWTSTTTKLTEDRIQRVPALIHQLWNEGHHSPFEHTFLSFRCVVDIATERQMIRHRIASYSVESARYRKYREQKVYIPEDLNKDWQFLLQNASESCWKLYDRVIESHEELGLSRARAKELARYFLPLSTQVELVVSYNLRSFLNFLTLRLDDHAQQEIREVARKMRQLVEERGCFRHTLEAFDIRRSK